MAEQPSLARKVTRVAIIWGGLTFLAWLPANLAMPLARDQGIFAFVGQAILDGGLPYIDAWEHKGPATHFLYAAGMWLFGPTAFGIRLFDNILTIAMAVGAWWLGRLRGRPIWGMLTGLFVWISVGGNYWHTAQVEGWLAYAFLLMLFALWLEPTRGARLTLITVGVVLAIGVLMKPNYVLLAPVVLVACGWRWRDLGWVTAGGAAMLGATFALFAAAGGLAAFWDAVVVFNLSSHATTAWSPNLLFEAFVWPRENELAIWVLEALALMGAWLMWRSDRRGFWILVSGALCGWLAGVSQGKGFYYHWMNMYVIFAAFAAEAVSWPGSARDRGARPREAFVAFACVILVTLTQPLYRAAKWWEHILGRSSVAAYEGQFCGEKFVGLGFCHRDLAAAAVFVRQNTQPGDLIYMWGMDALMHLEAERRSPTRFGFNYEIVGATPAYAAAKKAEVMAALAARPPAAIIVQELDVSNITPLSARQQLAHFPELQALIDRDYRDAFANANFTVYLRR